METIVTIEHIRQHVLDDAADLISAIGIMDPLIYGDLNKLSGDEQHVGRFLPKLLARNVVLILTRLHETSKRGPAGMTASIDALLDQAHHQLPGERITKFKERRIALIATQSNGIPYNDLYASGLRKWPIQFNAPNLQKASYPYLR